MANRTRQEQPPTTKEAPSTTNETTTTTAPTMRTAPVDSVLTKTATTSTTTTIDSVPTTVREKGKTSGVIPKDILLIPDTPPVVHEITVILRFGTSYESVDWLAKRLQFASKQLAQEHKDRDMIQKAILGSLESEDERELQRIGRQRDARNKGMAIQLPPLHSTLIEVHKESTKVMQEAKDIAEVGKRMRKDPDQMYKEWVATTKGDEELSVRLKKSKQSRNR